MKMTYSELKSALRFFIFMSAFSATCAVLLAFEVLELRDKLAGLGL